MTTLDKAFSEGSDARRYGLPKYTNPYSLIDSHHAREAWYRGWEHCHRQWGLGARWPVAILPKVRA